MQRNCTNLKLERRKRQVSCVVQISNYRVLYYSDCATSATLKLCTHCDFIMKKNVFSIKFCAENFIISIFCSHLLYFISFDKKFVWHADCSNGYHVVQYKIKRPLNLHNLCVEIVLSSTFHSFTFLQRGTVFYKSYVINLNFIVCFSY